MSPDLVAVRVEQRERLVAPVALDAAVDGWVTAILAAGPRAVRLQKRLIQDWERMSIRDSVWQGIRAVVEARRTDEPRRLMQAFVERRRR